MGMNGSKGCHLLVHHHSIMLSRLTRRNLARARARDLEHTFDYEDYFCNEQELEERELSSKIHELREQNGFLEHMCSLVLQKVRAGPLSALSACVLKPSCVLERAAH